MKNKIILLALVPFLLTFLMALVLQYFIKNDLLLHTAFGSIWLAYSLIRVVSIIFIIVYIYRKLGLNLFRSFVFTILIIEGVLTVIPRSMGGASFLRITWYAMFYRPLNPNGFRDDTVFEAKKENIVFIGDSFTAGLGIKSIKDRFDKVCIATLGDDYYSINLGQPGTGVLTQLENLKKYAPNANKVVYQYFANDIDDTVIRLGRQDLLPINEKDLTSVGKNPLIYFSYIINTVYWSLPMLWIDFKKYYEYPKAVWGTEEILKAHKEEIQQLIDYCNHQGKMMYVVVFPNLIDIEGSKSLYIGTITDFFKTQSIPVLNVAEYIDQTPKEKLVVNFQDGHPSKLVHSIVGKELAKLIASDK